MNLDSVDHKSHIASSFLSGGLDSVDMRDPNFPVVLPRILREVRLWCLEFWYSNDFDS